MQTIVTIVTILSLVTLSHCCNSVYLQARRNETTYLEWLDLPITLYCPITFSIGAVWVSSAPIFSNSLDCITNKNMLTVDVFPDNAKITFTHGKSNTENKYCEFVRNDKTIVATISEAPVNGKIIEIEHEPGAKLNVLKHMCFQEIDIKISRCPTISQMSTSSRVTVDNYETIQQTWVNVIVNQENCTERLVKEDKFLRSIFLHDVNECEEAKDKNIGLCKWSECIDLADAYICYDGDYLNTESCSDIPHWRCPYAIANGVEPTSYCHMNRCKLAAFHKIQLCKGGANDCVAEGDTFRCTSGIPYLDNCYESRDLLHATCPKITTKRMHVMLQRTAGPFNRYALSQSRFVKRETFSTEVDSGGP